MTNSVGRVQSNFLNQIKLLKNLLLAVLDGIVTLCLPSIGELVCERLAKFVCTTAFSVHKSVLILLAPTKILAALITISQSVFLRGNKGLFKVKKFFFFLLISYLLRFQFQIELTIYISNEHSHTHPQWCTTHALGIIVRCNFHCILILTRWIIDFLWKFFIVSKMRFNDFNFIAIYHFKTLSSFLFSKVCIGSSHHEHFRHLVMNLLCSHYKNDTHQQLNLWLMRRKTKFVPIRLLTSSVICNMCLNRQTIVLKYAQ